MAVGSLVCHSVGLSFLFTGITLQEDFMIKYRSKWLLVSAGINLRSMELPAYNERKVKEINLEILRPRELRQTDTALER